MSVKSKSIYETVFNDVPAYKPEITENIQNILSMRYFAELPDGTKEQTYEQMCQRVSRIVASTDFNTEKNNIDEVRKIEKAIYNDMYSQKFLFNSPCLFNAGVGLTKNSEYSHYIYDKVIDNYDIIKNNFCDTQMLFACFVIPVPDSLDAIFDSVKDAATISKYGGGVGANFGYLREKNANIRNGDLGGSSGPVSFMKVWNTMGSVVVQGGKRRAALMGMLNSNHPDVEEFIDAKTKEGELMYFNISVAIDDVFMEAVKKNSDYDLISPCVYKKSTDTDDKTKVAYVNGVPHKIVKTLKARDLWEKICGNAWKRGDPGIFFIDIANRDSLLSESTGKYKFNSTNPCLTGDMKIAVADGRGSVNIKQLSDEGKDVPVYCLDDNDKLCIEIMRNPRITGYNEDIYEIILDDGSIIKSTGNHKFRLHDGKYVEAKNLKNGDSLTILHRKNVGFYDRNKKGKYSYLGVNGKYYKPEHRLIAEFNYGNIPKYNQVHHIDGNSLNNSPDNLLIVSKEQHEKIHNKSIPDNTGKKYSDELKEKIGKATTYRFENDEKYRKRHSEAVSSAMNNNDNLIHSIRKYRHIDAIERLKDCQKLTDLTCFVENGSVKVKKICEICGKEFSVLFKDRERCLCSMECSAKKHSIELKGIPISDIKRKNIENKKSEIREQQIKAYSALKFKLNREPQKEEWIKYCKELNISNEISRSSSPFRYYKDLQEASKNYNHKVIDVKYIGKETVYNGTVDNKHNYFIDITNNIDNNYNWYYVNTMNCGEQPQQW